MKIIDQKGRLFSKINLFDLIVVLMILAGVIGVILRSGIAGSTEDTAVKTERATFTYQLEGVQECVATAFKKGDEIYENGVLLGVLSKTPEVKPYQTMELLANGEEKMVDHALLYSATLTLETDKFRNVKGYRIDTNEMLNGTGHIISNGFVTCSVIVTDVEPAKK